MLKTLGAQIKEFKRASIATPIFMILEVVMERCHLEDAPPFAIFAFGIFEISHLHYHQEIFEEEDKA